jgi:hypothetical protein
MYIYKGCPLIARQNDNKFQMYMNNETFEVTDYDEDKIYLWTERLNDKGEKSIPLMLILIWFRNSFI